MSDEPTIQETYERYAASGYDRRWQGHRGGSAFAAAERDVWLATTLCPAADGLIVDVGCGDGNLAATLDRAGCRPLRFLGIDLIEQRIEWARVTAPWAEFAVADGEHLPVPDGSCSAIAAVAVLSSILDASRREAMLAGFVRAIRPGGRLVVYDLRWRSPANPMVRPVPPHEIERALPGWSLTSRTMTVAPPIARSRLAAGARRYRLLAAVPALRSHVAISAVKPR